MAKAKKMDASEIKDILVKEGLDVSNVEIALGIVGDDVDAVRKLAEAMAHATAKKTEKEKKEKAEKKEKKEGREKEIQAALVRVCGEKVPDCYNSVRDEKRFSAPRKDAKIPENREVKKDEKSGSVVKVHDRDLFGIRFTDSTGINFTFQAELPFERRGKLDLTDSEHATRKEEILKKIHSVLMGAMTEKGEFLVV